MTQSLERFSMWFSDMNYLLLWYLRYLITCTISSFVHYNWMATLYFEHSLILSKHRRYLSSDELIFSPWTKTLLGNFKRTESIRLRHFVKNKNSIEFVLVLHFSSWGYTITYYDSNEDWFVICIEWKILAAFSSNVTNKETLMIFRLILVGRIIRNQNSNFSSLNKSFNLYF